MSYPNIHKLYEYETLGRLSSVSRAGQTMTALKQKLSYNIRSWLTGISGDLFTERYGYNLNGNMTSRTKAVQLTDSSGNTTLANLVARNSYTGKELATETGLYDFCARYLETSMGRFTTIDPLAEKYPSVSPYVYCAGDPVNRVDPDGKSWFFNQTNGAFVSHIDDDDDRVYLLTTEQIMNSQRKKWPV